jgi:hypothetical protein
MTDSTLNFMGWIEPESLVIADVSLIHFDE